MTPHEKYPEISRALNEHRKDPKFDSWPEWRLDSTEKVWTYLCQHRDVWYSTLEWKDDCWFYTGYRVSGCVLLGTIPRSFSLEKAQSVVSGLMTGLP